MIGRLIQAILIVLLPALLLAIVLPGHRAGPEIAAIATVNWRSPESGGLESFEQSADLATCRLAQWQFTHRRNATIGQVSVECLRQESDLLSP